MKQFDNLPSVKSTLYRKIRNAMLLFCCMAFVHSASALTISPTTLTDPNYTAINNGTGVITAGAGVGLISLRSALQACDQTAGPHIINLTLPGTYQVTGGSNIGTYIIFGSVNSQNITINGLTPATSIINMNPGAFQDRIFGINVATLGGTLDIKVTINNCRFTNGRLLSDPYGGGAIEFASSGNGSLLTLNGCEFLNNTIDATAGTTGGAVNYSGSGTLTVTNCIFTGNTNDNSDGGALYYFFNNISPTNTGLMNVTGCTFTSNTASALGGGNGGALGIALQGRNSVNQNFTGNITKNNFISNTAPLGDGGAIIVDNGDPAYVVNINYNRFFNNATSAVTAATSGLGKNSSSGNVIATNNWWGCNTDPLTAGACNRAAIVGAGGTGTLTTNPWLQLRTTASPNPICNTAAGLGNTTTVTTSFLSNSAGTAVPVGNLDRLIGLPVTWSATQGSLSAQQLNIQASGTATATFTSNGTGGITATVNAQVDNVPSPDPASPGAGTSITVNAKPTVTDPSNVTSCVGSTAIFTSTITGVPAPGIVWRIGATALVNGVQGSGSTVSGQGTNTLTITNVQPGDASANYNVMASNQCGTATSTNATLAVNSVTAGTVGSDQTICSLGDPVAFTETLASTGNGTLTYQWESSTTSCAAGFAPIGGATATTYDAPAGLAFTTYYHRVTISTLNGVACTAISNCITVTVNNVTGGTVGSDQGVCTGADPAAFTQTLASTGSGALTYQWQSSTTSCAAGFSDIGAATGITYDPPAGIAATTYYHRVTTSTLSGVPCTANSNCITVTVNPPNTITLTSAPGTDNQTVLINTPITNITYATTGATGASFSGLPPGVTGNWAANTFTISGSPTSPGTYNYTITLTGGACATVVTATGTINVVVCSITRTSAAGTNAQTVCINAPITNITYSTTGATGATFSGLPAGVTGAWAANVATISGSPTVYGTFNYTVTPTGGGCGGGVTATGSITINPDTWLGGTSTNWFTASNWSCGVPGPTTDVTIPSGTPNSPTIAGGTAQVHNITLQGGAILTNNATLNINGGGVVTNNGTYTGSGAWTGTLFNNNGGQVSPGNSPGCTSFGSGYTNGSGTVNIEIAGTTPCTQHDQIQVTGTATLSGTLNVILFGGYVPSCGESYKIMTSTTLVGTFTTINYPVLPAGLSWGIQYNAPNPGDVTLNIIGNPTATATPSSQPICSGSAITPIVLSGSPIAGTVYNWTRDNLAAATGIPASGTGNISGSLTNTTTSSVTVIFTITPTSGSCTGTPITATVVVNPTPDVNQPASQTVCNGALTAPVNFTGSVAGTIFSWTNTTTSIGLAASGSGNIASFTGTNATNAPVTGTITVTPSTGTPVPTSFNFTGAMQTFTVPAGVTSINIDAYGGQGANGFTSTTGSVGGTGGLGGNTKGTLAVVPGQVLNIFVGGAGTTSNGGFNGGGNAGAVNEAGGGGGASDVRVGGVTLANRVIVAGGGGGGGNGGSFASGPINPIPGGNGGNGNGLNGANGTNSSAGGGGGGAVGSAGGAAGSGCSAFPASAGGTGVSGQGGVGGNDGNCCSPVRAGGGGGGGGFTGGGAGGGAGVGTVGCSLNDNGGGGGGAGGSFYTGGVTSPTTANGVQSGNGKVVITYIPGGATCTGPPKTFTITVNPTATVNAVPNQTVCNGATQPAILFSSPTTGGSIVYNWVNNTSSIGLAASGSGDIAAFTATNATNAPVVANITVTPAYTNNGVTCNGTPMSFTITVNPTPTATAVPSSQTICSANPITTIVLSGSAVAGTVYNWTRDNNATVTGIAASGAGNISGTLTNTTNIPITVTFTITPAANGCNGTPITATVLVNPTPNAVAAPSSQTVCSGVAITTIVLSGNVAGTVYNWTRNNTGSVTGIAASGSGNISGTLTNTTAAPVTVTFTITPTANGCGGTPVTATVLVNPTPTATATPSSQTVCSGVAINPIVLSGNPVAGVVYNWTRDNAATVTGIAASGAGNISGTLTNLTNAPITVTFTITPTANGCPGTPVTATVLVNPTPNAVAAPSSQTVCSGVAITTIVISGNVAGTVYNWTRNNTGSVTGIAASGSGNISGTLTNTTAAPVTVTFTITPTANGCGGTPITATVLVNPTPTATATPSSQTVCSGVAINPIILSGNPVAGVVYNWTRDNTATVTGIAASGAGNISGTLTNTVNIPITVTFTITPTANGCPGTPVTATVLVNPTPNATASPSSQTICNNLPITTIVISGNVAGTVFNWSRDNTGTVTGIAASGTGNISGTLNNTTSAPVTVTFTITPTANGCNGTPVTATVTVNPTPTATATPSSQTVCSGVAITTIVLSGSPVAGTVYNWTRDNVGTVTGIAASGAGNISGTLTNTTNIPITVTFTITPAANGCNGAPVTATVLVNPTPNATATPPTQTICTGSTTQQITFTGTVAGTTYSWVRDNNATVTGLPANGTGNVPAAALTNVTNAPVTVTFTITPTANGCPGPTITATIIVNPIPNAVATPASQTTCSGSAITTIVLSGNVAGTVYSWTRDNIATVTGIAASGTGDISGTLTNTTFAPITVTFTITPSFTNAGVTCTGTPITATVTVNPIPNAVATPSSQTICNNTTITTIALTGNVPGTVYNWVRDNNATVVGIAASGTGDISGTLTNTTNAPVTVTFTITPTFTNGGITCSGPSITATVLVNPTPTATAAPISQAICSGSAITTIVITGPVAGTVFNWTRDNNATATGIPASGSGNISGSLTNTTNAPVLVTFTITPVANGCTGPTSTATVLVDPTPQVNQPPNQIVCNNTATAPVIFTGPVAGTIFNWTNNNTSIGLAGIGVGNIASFIATNPTNVPVTATITVTPSTNYSGSVTGFESGSFNPEWQSIGQTAIVGPYGGVNPTQGVLQAHLVNHVGVSTATLETFLGQPAGSIDAYLGHPNTEGSAIKRTVTVNAGDIVQVDYDFMTAEVIPSQWDAALFSVAGNGYSMLASTYSSTFIPIAPNPGGYSSHTGYRTISYTFTSAGTYTIGLLPLNGYDFGVNSGLLVDNFRINGGGGCTGPSKTFTITVNPTPHATATPSSQSVCSGSAITPIVLTSDVAGTTYAWTRDNNVNVTGIAASGSSNPISGTLTNNTAVTQVVTFTITPTANGCPGPSITATVTVFPTPSANQVQNQVLCNGSATALIHFSGPVAGTIYNWTNNTPAIGLAPAGTGDIPSFIATNTTNAPLVATITVTPASNGCPGPTMTFTITVNPTPVVNQPANQVVCNNTATAAVNFTSPTTGGTIVYNWTHTGAAIGLGPDGVGNIPSFTAINTTGAPVVATITVIATYTNAGVSCISQPVSFTITVNPTPTVNQPANQTVCNNTATTAVNFTGNTPGAVYNWTNNTPSIGLAAAGTGNIPSFTATNATGAPVTATITVTPAYTNAGVTCTGTPVTFTITVNPTPTVNAVASQTVCNGVPTAAITFTGNAAGTVYSWTNNNTSIGLAAAGTGNIASFTAINNGAAPVVATITVTPTYTNNGTTCTGTPVSFTITVNPTPTVNSVANQTLCNGATTTAINFTGAVTGTTYNWTNNNTSIGLAASGTGNIAAFTATNTTSSPVTATITVTPTANGCAGNPVTFTITVNPTPAVNPVANQSVCTGAATAAVNFTSLTPGTTFTWTNNTPSIGLAASGTGNIPGFTAVNAAATPVTATITVTPSANGCTGAPITFTITVNPRATVAAVANQTLCNGSATTAVTFTGTVAGTIFNWTNNTPSIGLAASGQGNIPSFIAVNNTAAPVTATITVTPTTASGCTGTAITFTITVNPTPTVNAIANQALCEGGTTTAIIFSGATTGTVFTWTNNNTAIGLPASGTGNINPFVVTNGTGSTIVATITVTGAVNGCTSTTRTFTITVFAGVNNIVITNAPLQVCLTDTLIQLSATPAGGTWSGRGVSGSTFNAAAAGVGTTTLTYTLGNGNCVGAASVNVTVRDCIERHNIFANAIHLYPNPNSGQFNIRYLSDVYKSFNVRIIDADGHIIRNYAFNNLVYGSVIPFDLRMLPSATYMLEVYNEFERSAFRVVIIH